LDAALDCVVLDLSGSKRREKNNFMVVFVITEKTIRLDPTRDGRMGRRRRFRSGRHLFEKHYFGKWKFLKTLFWEMKSENVIFAAGTAAAALAEGCGSCGGPTRLRFGGTGLMLPQE